MDRSLSNALEVVEDVAWWRRPVRAATDLLFPPACVCCGGECELSGGPQFCASCSAALAIAAGPACPRCAQACSEAEVALGRCHGCRRRKLRFASARTIGPHRGNLRQAVLRAKHRSGEALARALGERLAATLLAAPLETPPDCVVPVPMHWLQRLRRGTNPALSIARGVADCLGLPLLNGRLTCIRLTPRQTSLSAAQRLENVRGAFRAAAHPSLAGRRVLLVDDVMTTCATAHEAARALLEAKADCIDVATVSRSDPEF